jgi:uncharacterized protein (DUF2147 family)
MSVLVCVTVTDGHNHHKGSNNGHLFVSGARTSQNCWGATVNQPRARRTIAAASISP